MIPVTRTGNAAHDMAAIMTRVRKMSDSQLADILSGKDVSVPQFAAMTEAMGRRQLRQAVDGAQAQQQAQQPSVKDQLLAEQQADMGGIAALPAPNMESVDMAGGGIIAFEQGGDVPRFYNGGDPWAAQRAREEDPDVFMSKAWFRKHFEGEGGLSGSKAAKKKADIAEQQRLNARENPEFGEPALRTDEDPYGKGVQVAPTVIPNSAPAVEEPPVNAAPAAPAAPKSQIDLSAPTKFERRASPFGQMSAEAVDYNKLKEQGLGEGLMKLGAGIMSAPGSKGYAAGIQALAESGALSRKEIAGLKKDARDYDLNLKKAEEAFQQGQDELGYKYMESANNNKYRMAMLNKPGEGLQLLQALGDPKLMARYQEMNAAKRPTDVISRKDALKEFNDDPRLKREFGDFETYYQTMNNRLLSGTLPQGAPVLGKV